MSHPGPTFSFQGTPSSCSVLQTTNQSLLVLFNEMQGQKALTISLSSIPPSLMAANKPEERPTILLQASGVEHSSTAMKAYDLTLVGIESTLQDVWVRVSKAAWSMEQSGEYNTEELMFFAIAL